MSRVSQNVAADNDAPAIVDLSITYTTDDPGITPNDTIAIADGDAVAGLAESVEDIVAKINEINSALRDAGIIR